MADKKDFVELAVYNDDRALLFDAGAEEPFVVVDGYNQATKDFSEKARYKDISMAVAVADPNNIPQATIEWSETDIQDFWVDEVMKQSEEAGVQIDYDTARESLHSSEYEQFHDSALSTLESGIRYTCIDMTYEQLQCEADDFVPGYVASQNEERSAR